MERVEAEEFNENIHENFLFIPQRPAIRECFLKNGSTLTKVSLGYFNYN